MKTIHATLAVAAVFILTACGGGGGGSGGPGPQGPTGPTTHIPPTPSKVSAVTETYGPSTALLTDLLRAHATEGYFLPRPDLEPYYFPPNLIRSVTPPTVRFAEGTTSDEQALTAFAVGLINRALPYDQHLKLDFDTVVPRGVGYGYMVLPERDPGTITAGFFDYNSCGVPTDGCALLAQPGRTGSGILLNRVLFSPQRGPSKLHVLVHELLHALGFDRDLEDLEFRESILGGNFCRADDECDYRNLRGDIPALDAAALLALFTRLGPVTTEQDSFDSLGNWNQQTRALSQTLGDITYGITYGVRAYNGTAQPWTDGTPPSRNLADTGLSGTGTWRGELVGLTPELDSVRGRTEIAVDFATLNGHAHFRDLQTWPGSAPGALGTGAPWQQGTLQYALTISGNYLRSPDNAVNGQFYGSAHTMVAGSLERADLTAAFGEAR